MAAEESLPPAAIAQMRQEKLMRAYRDLFGDNQATRSEAQILVWEDLQKVGYARQTVFIPDRNGAVCPMRAAFADGRRSVLLYIESNVSFVPAVTQQSTTRT